MNARAFTIGNDIGFSQGEYKPGTLVGDALIAHELAHTLQQRGGGEPSAPILDGRAGDDRMLEAEADRSAGGALSSPLRGLAGAFPRTGARTMVQSRSGLRLQRCAGTSQNLVSSTEIQRRLIETRQLVERSVPEQNEARGRLTYALSQVEANYQVELRRAGTDAARQAQAQRVLLENIERVRSSITQQAEMTQRYGIRFDVHFREFRQPSGPSRYDIRPWSQSELQQIDTILRRVPRTYLGRIRTIQRQPGESPTTPAAWNQGESTLKIYDSFFASGRRDDERLNDVLHEIGHSTYVTPPPEEAGGFPHLPPEPWSLLSDWRRSTVQTLASDLGVSQQRGQQIIRDLTEKKRRERDFPRPVQVGRRWALYDKHEPPESAPTRFFHYSDEHREHFVSDYARTHPGEDLADSFSYYLSDPQIYLIHRSARARMGEAKWRYLEQHYPQRLRGE
jgi:hypothetical protein